MLKLSQTSKMPCLSWSLPALVTCPGARDKDGAIVEACAGCYARPENGGNYARPAVISAREHNREDWRRTDWVAEMTEALSRAKYFRWFDSGDIYHVELARKILEVVRATPETRHWIPTRSYKIGRIRAVLEQIAQEPNAMVRYSSDSISGEFSSEHGSTIYDPNGPAPLGTFLCGAYTRGGKCGDCRACWSKEIPVVAYPGHGRKMSKLQNRS